MWIKSLHKLWLAFYVMGYSGGRVSSSLVTPFRGHKPHLSWSALCSGGLCLLSRLALPRLCQLSHLQSTWLITLLPRVLDANTTATARGEEIRVQDLLPRPVSWRYLPETHSCGLESTSQAALVWVFTCPPDSRVEIWTPNVVVLGGKAFGRPLVIKSGTLTKRLQKDPVLPCEATGRGPSPDTKSARPWS